MPIHKPYDRVFKAFPEEAPRLFLGTLGEVPADEEEVSLEPLPRETAPPVVLPDVAIRVERQGRPPFIFHAEFEGRLRPAKIPTIALYGGGLVTQYRLPVRTSILLLVPSRLPAEDRGIAVYAVEQTEIRHPYKVVRVWDLDATHLLASNNPRLFPWAVLMKTTDAQVREIGAALGRLGDEEQLGRFNILAGLRYDKDELLEMTGGTHMSSIAEVLWEESSFFRDLREKVEAEAQSKGLEGLTKGLNEGLVQGLAEGKAEGKRVEALRLLRTALAKKFPGLEAAPELDSIRDVEPMEAILIQHVLGESGRATVEEAIRAAAAGNA